MGGTRWETNASINRNHLKHGLPTTATIIPPPPMSRGPIFRPHKLLFSPLVKSWTRFCPSSELNSGKTIPKPYHHITIQRRWHTKKMMAGAAWWALWKTSRTAFSLSPTHLLKSCGMKIEGPNWSSRKVGGLNDTDELEVSEIVTQWFCIKYCADSHTLLESRMGSGVWIVPPKEELERRNVTDVCDNRDAGRLCIK